MIKVNSIQIRVYRIPIFQHNINEYLDVTQEERQNARAYLSNLHLQPEPTKPIPNIPPSTNSNNKHNHMDYNSPQIHQQSKPRPQVHHSQRSHHSHTPSQQLPSYSRHQEPAQYATNDYSASTYYSQHPKELPISTKENILLAVFALLNELDDDGLTVVRKQLDKMCRDNQLN